MSDASPAASTGFGFRWQLLSWMLLVALIPGGVVAYVCYSGARQALLAAVRSKTLSVVGARRDQIHHWLAERDADLRVLGSSRECLGHVRQGPPGSAERDHAVCAYLDTFQRRSQSYHAISLYDGAWSWIAGTPGDPPGGVLGVHPELREGVQRPGAGAQVAVRPLTGGGVGLALTHRLQPAAGPPEGHVVTLLDLSQTLWPLLAGRTGLGRSGTVYLVGGGRYLSPPRPAEAGAVLRPVDARVWDGPDGAWFYRDHRGVPVIGAHARLPDRDWVVVAEIELSEALAGLDGVRRRALAINALSLLVVVLASLLLSRQLTRPLRALAGVARQVSAGGTEARTDVDGGGELRQVGRAFNQMLDDLADVRERLVRTAALAAVGELSASVVHQMRNPLSSVKLNVQALLAGSSADDRELGQIALDQVARLERMLEALLRFGKPVEPILAPVAVGELLADGAELAGAACAAHQVRLHTDDRSGGARVGVDRELVAQALGNLLTNAAQASPPGGAVGLTAALDHETLVVEVTDDGPGVPEAARAKLFRPFFTTRRDGTGLGLAFVRKVAELHGGEAAHQAGSPSTFTLRLPARTLA